MLFGKQQTTSTSEFRKLLASYNLFGPTATETTETTQTTETPTEQPIEDPFNLQETTTITFERYHRLQEQIRVLEAELSQKDNEAK
jgi:hypothetical protein